MLGAGARSPRAGSSAGLGRRGPGAAARDLWGSADSRRGRGQSEEEGRAAHHTRNSVPFFDTPGEGYGSLKYRPFQLLHYDIGFEPSVGADFETCAGALLQRE